MPLKKFLKRSMTTAKKFVKKRYGLNKRSSGLKYGRIAQDVMMLKKMVNAEKKHFSSIYSKVAIGQVSGNLTGAVCLDVTPLIDQGSGPTQRNGSSVKLHSALYQFQLSHQALATISNKCIIEFWINKGQPLDTATLLDQTHAAATFSGVIDSNSPRNQDRFSDYQLVRRIKKTLPADPNPGDINVITFDVPVKFNRGQGHHIRLVNSLSGTPQNDVLNGQMFMTIRADNGNSAGTVSTRDVPFQGVTTGMVLRFGYKVWYYDN